MKLLLTLSISLLFIACEDIDLNLENQINTNPTSCLELLNTNPTLSNGNYYIDHDSDSSTAKVEVFCDMNNGGYTQILNDASDFSSTQLAHFCDISAISSFYTDSTYGIGWGNIAMTSGSNPNPTQMECIVCENIPAFSEVKVTLGANANVVGNQTSYGYMYIDDKDNTNYSDSDYYLAFLDAWGNDSWAGNRVVANGVIVQNNIPNVNLIDFEATINQSGNNIRICMSGEAPGVYNKRHMKNLKFK